MQFDEQFLEEMGLAAMPEERKGAFLAYLQDELEVRIGERISEGVAEERLAEFDRVETQEEAAEWLRANRPDYREVVDRTIEEMKREIEANRGSLLGETADMSEEDRVAPEVTENETGVAADAAEDEIGVVEEENARDESETGVAEGASESAD